MAPFCPDEIFLEKPFMYLLPPFIVQNLKNPKSASGYQDALF